MVKTRWIGPRVMVSKFGAKIRARSKSNGRTCLNKLNPQLPFASESLFRGEAKNSFTQALQSQEMVAWRRLCEDYAHFWQSASSVRLCFLHSIPVCVFTLRTSSTIAQDTSDRNWLNRVDHLKLLGCVLINARCVDQLCIVQQKVPTKKRLHAHLADAHQLFVLASSSTLFRCVCLPFALVVCASPRPVYRVSWPSTVVAFLVSSMSVVVVRCILFEEQCVWGAVKRVVKSCRQIFG